jgi:heme exporter protein A
LWLLDEPTTALDKKGQDLLRAQIIRHRAQGGIVIAATHDELGIANVQRVEMRGTP